MAYGKVGDLQGGETSANTGDFQRALRSYARSAALLEPIVARNPANQGAAASLAQSYVQRARRMPVSEPIAARARPCNGATGSRLAMPSDEASRRCER